MLRPALLLVAPLLLLASIASPLRAEAISSEEVRRSIERGVNYLKSKQNKVKGNWAEHPGQPGGMTALCTLALLEAGVDPRDESIQKALNYLRGLGKPKMVYATSLATMAFVAADPSPRNKDLALIRRNAEYLASIQITRGGEGVKKGAWAYSDSQGNGDNSNTQFALLALNEAERVGVKIRDDVWRLGLNYWLDVVDPTSGGWGYFQGQPVTGSMTCAGISSVVICSSKIRPTDAKVEGDAIDCCGGEENDKAAITIGRALQWMGKHFSASSNPSSFADAPEFSKLWLLYYLYGVERVGRLTGQRFFEASTGERHDWYRAGAEWIVRKGQDKITGGFSGVGHGEDNPLIGTSFALLFLAKGLRPVVISNLERPESRDWELHRTAVGNLTRNIESRWGRTLTWQNVNSRAATSADLLQSPVLFISGRDGLKLTPKEKEAIKGYVNSGGFIFAERCCEGPGFDRDFRALMKELFPDSPLQPLPPDHPVWFAEVPVNPEETPLEGLNTCCRTSVIYCKKDLSCLWELAGARNAAKYSPSVQARIDRAIGIGANVVAYATGRELRDKLDIPSVVKRDENRSVLSRNTLYVAKLRHAGGSDDAPSALANLMSVGQQEVGLAASAERRMIGLGDNAIFDYPIVFMHGRRAFRFTEEERQQLRAYLERGGFLFADAICASPDFTQSFRREMGLIFRDAKLTRLPESHQILTSEYRGYDVTKVNLRDPSFRAEGDPLKAKVYRTSPTLEGLELDGRLAVVFSPYDLSCALENSPSLECKGYDRRDAARIGVNVLMYALQQ